MISVLSSSPPEAPRSSTTARSIARPAYMPAVIPAGPAPMITTSYSCVVAISTLVDLRWLNARLSGGVPAPNVENVERPVTVRNGSHQYIGGVVRRRARDHGVALEHRLRVEHAYTVCTMLAMKNDRSRKGGTVSTLGLDVRADRRRHAPGARSLDHRAHRGLHAIHRTDPFRKAHDVRPTGNCALPRHVRRAP